MEVYFNLRLLPTTPPPPPKKIKTTTTTTIIIIIIIIIEKIKRELRQKYDTVFSLNQCHLLSEN